MRTRAHLLATLVAALLVAHVAAAGAAGVDTRTELRAATQQARDGDLQADWNKMLDARARFAAVADDEELAPLAYYYMGYTDWRLSSLAFMAVGASAQVRLAERAMASLEVAIQKRPDFPDAHALLTVAATRMMGNPSVGEQMMPRIRAGWQAALPAGAGNPRASCCAR